MEYRRTLRGSEERLWSTENRIVLEWAGGRESTGISGENGSRLSAKGCDESEQAIYKGGSRLGLEEDITGVGWERVYRGKRSVCVVGSLAQGTRTLR